MVKRDHFAKLTENYSAIAVNFIHSPFVSKLSARLRRALSLQRSQ